MTDINIGQITEALNDKMDRDAHNVQSPSAVIIEKQDPTAANNYTWYRKYSDGWVEQGGYLTADTTGAVQAVSLPIEMSDNNYQTLKILSRCAATTNGFNWGYFSDKASTDPSNTSTTAYFSIPSTSYCLGAWWQVSGIAAN